MLFTEEERCAARIPNKRRCSVIFLWKSGFPPITTIQAGNGSVGDEFGWGIALSQNHAMIGAWGDDEAGTDAGAFYVFE